MLKKTIYLYFGLPKTEDISLQDTINVQQNLKLLQKANINFCHLWAINNTYELVLAFSDKCQDKNADRIESIYNDLREELKSDRPFFINCRTMFLEDKEIVVNLKKFIYSNSEMQIDFKVVLCVRSPEIVINRLFQDAVLNMGASNYKECIDIVKKYYGYVSLLTDIFEKENITLHSYEEISKFEYGIVGYILNVLGMDRDSLSKINYKKEIESLSYVSVEIAKFINKTEPIMINGNFNKNRFKRDFDPLIFKIKGSEYILEKEEFDEIYSLLKFDLEYLKENYKIDYTKIKYENRRIPNYDEDSVKLAFDFSSSLIRKYIVDFFLKENKKLGIKLNESTIKISNKVKQIILHTGLPKTATTSIQNTYSLIENKNLLGKNNIFVFQDEFQSNNAGFSALMFNKPKEDIIFSRHNLSDNEIDIELEKIHNSISKALDNENTLLISCERFTILNDISLNNLKLFIQNTCKYNVEFKIITFVRNPISFFPSIDQMQNIGIGITDFNQIRQNINGYFNSFRFLLNVFGREDINIYMFEDACQHEFGPVGYFFEKLGLAKSELALLNYQKDNIGLSLEATNILTYINNKEPMFVDGILNSKRTMDDCEVLRNIKGDKYKLNSEKMLSIYEGAYENLVFLRDNFNVDFTQLREQILNIEEPSNNFDEQSIIDTFITCNDFYKKCMLEFYFISNKHLYEMLNKVNLNSIVK